MDELDFTVQKLGESNIQSPLKHLKFERPEAKVFYHKDPDEQDAYFGQYGKRLCFEKAGPREKIFHDPSWTRAAILTAGGLCPGLNNVIKSLTLTLKLHYNVPVVYGIKYGYMGLNPEAGCSPLILTPEIVADIHEEGGTILGSSRGNQDASVMVETLVRMNINVLFCIGGDGTLRGAHAIAEEITRRKLSISVIGIPKTIDNDICFTDRTFGFGTAVMATVPVITSAHNEAKGAPGGIGLIHVMGRDSGFIAAYASLANTHVNYCLIPEEKFTLSEGPNALLPHLMKRIRKRGHAVIIVSEGAGQELFDSKDDVHDASGNKLNKNIGLFLKDKIQEYAKNEKVIVNIKYFEPAYQIRSIPAMGEDAVFCSLLAQNAVHAGMMGRSDMVVGHWSDSFIHVPIKMATRERKKIIPDGGLWRSVRLITWPEYQ